MPYGLEWLSNNGRLAISSAAYGMVFLGNATYLGTNAGTGFGVGSYQANFKRYRIVSATRPVVFMQLSSSVRASVQAVVNMGGNDWDVIVGCANFGSFTPVIKCFAKLSGAGGSGYGIRVFDASGNRAWDSTENMLVWKAKNSWSAGTTSDSVSHSVSTPYILGRASGYRITQAGGPVLFDISYFVAGFTGDSTTVTRATNAIQTNFVSTADPPDTDDDLQALTTYLINGSQYT